MMNIQFAFILTLNLALLEANQAREVWIGTAPFCKGSPRDCVNNGMVYVRSDKSGDGKKCWSGTKVLCRENPTQLPFVWFGTSPFCDGSSNDCDIFDFNYIRSDKSGDGKTCLTGTKVFCEVKKPKLPRADNDRDKFSIVTYNIFGRPFIITHDGQRERTCHIPRTLFQQFPTTDAIIFQEAFMDGCIPEIPLRNLLQLYGFNYSTPTVGNDVPSKTGITFLNGGVFVASRWPITHTSQEIFEDATTFEADRLAKKGVVHAQIEKLGQTYHIFGTHLQAQEGVNNDKVRILQAKQMSRFINKQIGPNKKSARVIVGGDLNADQLGNPAHSRDIEGALDVTYLPKASSSLSCTSCKDMNVLVEASYPRREWLDYIAISKKHAQPKSGEMKSFALRSDKTFSFCYSAPLQPHYVFPNSKFCKKKLTTNELSDHFPVFASIKF